MSTYHDVVITLVSQDRKCHAGHKVGDQFRAGRFAPPDLCMGALSSLMPYIMTLRFGGSFPWEEREGEGTMACPDHLVRNVFHLKRVEEKVGA